MVSSWASEWNDSGWSQFLTLGSIRCIRNVSKLVTKSGITKLSRWNVTLLPKFAICFSILFTKQSELRARRFSKPFLLSNKSILQPNEHNLFSYIAALFTNVAKLYSDVTKLFGQLFIFAVVAVLLSNKSQLSSNKPSLFCILLADKSVFAYISVV